MKKISSSLRRLVSDWNMCQRPLTRIEEEECPGRLKCLATGLSRWWMVSARCSLKRVDKERPVSPMYISCYKWCKWWRTLSFLTGMWNVYEPWSVQKGHEDGLRCRWKDRPCSWLCCRLKGLCRWQLGASKDVLKVRVSFICDERWLVKDYSSFSVWLEDGPVGEEDTANRGTVGVVHKTDNRSITGLWQGLAR